MSDIERFADYLKDRVSPNTVRVYTYAVEQWLRTLNGNKPSQQGAQSYINRLIKAGRAPNTVSLRAYAIIRFFKWKGKAITLDRPAIRIGEPDYLVLDQIEALLAVCNTVLERVLITVLFDTAVRVSELLNLELDDINRHNGFISVIRKGGRREEVNISEKGMNALEDWLDARESESNRVFMDLSYYDTWALMRRVGKRAHIKVHPHIFRHSRAIHMLMNGAELHTVKEHLGHKNEATTANIYGRFKAVHLKELVPAW